MASRSASSNIEEVRDKFLDGTYDLIIAAGWKHEGYPKIVIVRDQFGEVPVLPEGLLAVVSTSRFRSMCRCLVWTMCLLSPRSSWSGSPDVLDRSMNWTPRLAILLSLVAGVLALGGAAVPLTDDPKFCAGCHVIAPSYESWAASSHKEVTCVACHVGPGLEGWLRDKVWAGTRDVARYAFGTPVEPHNLSANVDSRSCLSCHRNILRVSEVAPRDLPSPVKEVGFVMNHRKHIEAFERSWNGEGCMVCHAGVVHDRPIKGYPIVVPRGHVHADGKPWYPDHPEGSHLRTRALNDCFRCHDGKTEYQGKVIERKCDICHPLRSSRRCCLPDAAMIEQRCPLQFLMSRISASASATGERLHQIYGPVQ